MLREWLQRAHTFPVLHQKAASGVSRSIKASLSILLGRTV